MRGLEVMAEGIPTKLTTLKGLTDEGVLTEDEFVERKTNLLDVYCDVEPTYAPVTKEERRGCLGLTSFGQTFAASSIGNICEWYDFAAFAGLADILGTKLFPPQSKTASLMETFSAEIKETKFFLHFYLFYFDFLAFSADFRIFQFFLFKINKLTYIYLLNYLFT